MYKGDFMYEKKEFTHFDEKGNARMVNVSEKSETVRKASACGKVYVNSQTLELIKKGQMKKGDVLTVAQVAGIMGAKKTPDIIPMCHPLFIDGVDVKLYINDEQSCIDIFAEVGITGKTGVEMEALTSVSVAALTVYDMCKAVQKDMVISDIKLLEKSGGKSGHYKLEEK